MIGLAFLRIGLSLAFASVTILVAVGDASLDAVHGTAGPVGTEPAGRSRPARAVSASLVAFSGVSSM
jgi:hypothetical protein